MMTVSTVGPYMMAPYTVAPTLAIPVNHSAGEDSLSDEAPDNNDPESGAAACWKKHVWSAEEDQKLRELIAACGAKVRWSVVGAAMSGRTGKQCRERWYNHLTPEVNKNKWSVDEDRAIIEAVHMHGTRWSEIVKMFPGRTDNSIKNRWNSMQRKEDRRQKRLHENSAFAAAAAAQAASQAAARTIVPAVAVSSSAAAEGKVQRRRLVQESDLQPASALLAVPVGNAHPAPLPALPAPHSALLQQLQATGTMPPNLKPAGRRKRAVQGIAVQVTSARDDLDAASLVLGLCGSSGGSSGPSTEPASASAVQQAALRHVAMATLEAAGCCMQQPDFSSPALAAPAPATEAVAAAPAADAAVSDEPPPAPALVARAGPVAAVPVPAAASASSGFCGRAQAALGVRKVAQLSMLQVPTLKNDKENSCSDSPCAMRSSSSPVGSPAGARVLTPAMPGAVPIAFNSSPWNKLHKVATPSSLSAQRVAASPSMEAASLLAGFAGGF